MAIEEPFELVLSRATGLRLRATSQPGHVLDTFFAGYDRVFADTSKKESLAGFAECLFLNSGIKHRDIQEQLGNFCEIIAVLLAADNTLIGGINVLVIETPLGKLTGNVNYAYILPEFRRRGHLSDLLRAITPLAHRYLSAPRTTPVLLFFETADPMLVSAHERDFDQIASGMSEIERLLVWDAMGARIVDIDYVQPALSDAQTPDYSLLYAVLGTPYFSLPSAELCAHLEQFFVVSVLKGKSLSTSTEADRLISDLKRKRDRNELIRLFPIPDRAQMEAAIAAAMSAPHGLGLLGYVRARVEDCSI